MFRGFGFVRGWLCRFSKLACLFLAKVLINSVCKIISASLALSVFGQVRFSKIVVLVCLRFCSAKSVFVASVWLVVVFGYSAFWQVLFFAIAKK